MSVPEPRVVRVFVVEDHPQVRDVVAKLIERSPDLALAGVADSAEAALAKINAAQPHLALVDISLPDTDGIRLIALLHEQYPDLLLLAVSGHDENVYGLPALRAGARGYLIKDNLAQLAAVIRTVAGGDIYVGESVRARLYAGDASRAGSPLDGPADSRSDSAPEPPAAP